MQHTAAVDGPYVLVGVLVDPQGEIAVELLDEPVADVARCDVLAVAAIEGAVVDGERHGHGGLVDGDAWQGLGVVGGSHGVADLESLDAYQGADVARRYLADLLASHALECVQLLDALARYAAVLLAYGYLYALAEGAAVYASDGDAAHVAREVERGDEHLCVALVGLRGGYVLDDGVEQGYDVVGGMLPVGAHPAVFGRAEYGGEVELVLGGVEAVHEVKYHVLHLRGTAVGLVDLVDHHEWLQADLDGLLEHESCLWHGALEGVDQQETSVGHIEHALHFAAKVGVSRGVDDVDLDSLVVDRYVFAQDSDAALALEVVVVEDKLSGRLVVAEEVAGQEHLVDQGRLAVVDVCDDGYVADVVHIRYWILAVTADKGTKKSRN